MSATAHMILLTIMPLILLLAGIAGCGGQDQDREQEISRDQRSGQQSMQQQDQAQAPPQISTREQAILAEARQVTQSFATELKQALMRGLSEGGPENALGICKDLAPEIAARISQQTGWEVARTSLKIRNPDNAPDDFERGVLEDFAECHQRIDDCDHTEHFAVIEEEGARVFRYMKAIPTAQLCLRCHGQDVAPETVAMIRELYPLDQAMGFRTGDVRGAFTLQRAL